MVPSAINGTKRYQLHLVPSQLAEISLFKFDLCNLMFLELIHNIKDNIDHKICGS